MEISRRDFVSLCAAAGATAAAGCLSAARGRDAFYGPTCRDRLWMWGHHVDMARKAAACCDDKAVRDAFRFPGRAVDQAEGCRLMGIPNNCVIRWGGLPKYPFGDYFDQFKGLKRISFDVYQGGESPAEMLEKLRIATEELLPALPNLTGCWLDDFFNHIDEQGAAHDLSLLERIADTLHGKGLRLSLVSYFSQLAKFARYRRYFDLVDEVSFWFWRGDSIPQMRDAVRRCRDFAGRDKSLLLGLYMWDFTTARPVPAELMAHQLACAGDFLADGTVDGLIFHPTFVAALDVPAVNLSKEWIRAHGDDVVRRA